MISRYLLNRISVMGPTEIPRRAVELGLDYVRFAGRRFSTPVPAQKFCNPFNASSTQQLSRIWDAFPWHAQALTQLQSGGFECNGEHYRLDATNPWVHCPDRNHSLPMIMGRRYLFARMYADANMQFIGTLNRHYHLVHLAKAARIGRLTNEQALAPIYDWIHANPYLEGVNWSDCLNHAVRIVNWSIAFSLLALDNVDAAISTSIEQHGRFIERHLSFGSSAGNHLLGELWGLFFIAHCFPGLPSAKRWRALVRAKLPAECERQFTSDGMHFERSVSYHRYVAEYLLLVQGAADNLGVDLGPTLRTQLRASLQILADMRNESGETCLFGDCGHEITTDIHYLAFWHDDMFDSIQALGAKVLGDQSLLRRLPADYQDQRWPWLFGDMAERREADVVRAKQQDGERHLSEPPEANSQLSKFVPQTCPHPAAHNHTNESTAYRDAGFFILRARERGSAGSGFPTCATIRCGEFGLAPLHAHAHADLLSFVLSVRGQQFLVDPGTYGYHFKGAHWRQYFRGTSAHNTLSLNQDSQARNGGAMIWLSRPEGELQTWSKTNDGTVFEGSHDGYMRDDGARATHVRRIELPTSGQNMHLVDWVKPDPATALQDPTFSVNSYLHFHPSVELTQLSSHHFRASRVWDFDDGMKGMETNSPPPPNIIDVYLDSSTDVHLAHGDDQIPLGWYSRYFGVKQPAHAIKMVKQIQTGDQLETIFDFTPDL